MAKSVTSTTPNRLSKRKSADSETKSPISVARRSDMAKIFVPAVNPVKSSTAKKMANVKNADVAEKVENKNAPHATGQPLPSGSRLKTDKIQMLRLSTRIRKVIMKFFCIFAFVSAASLF